MQQRERIPTLHNSMDGTGEHYAKWNKPGNERQILYDLTFNWNLINTMNKQAKYNQGHWKWERSDSDERGGDNGGKGWRVYRNNYKGHMDNNKEGVETEEGGGEGWDGGEGLEE